MRVEHLTLVEVHGTLHSINSHSRCQHACAHSNPRMEAGRDIGHTSSKVTHIQQRDEGRHDHPRHLHGHSRAILACPGG
jgi:hypothetical protein